MLDSILFMFNLTLACVGSYTLSGVATRWLERRKKLKDEAIRERRQREDQILTLLKTIEARTSSIK